MSFNLADLFEIVVDTIPDRLALVAGDVRLSFVELDQRSNRLANYFGSLGIRTGDKIGIHAQNRAEWVEAMLAAFKLRAVPININYRYVEHELAYLYDNADLVALVHERRYAPVIASVADKVPMLRNCIVLEDGSMEDCSALGSEPYEQIMGRFSPERCFEERSGDDIYMLYTGGTTGMPKGAVWRHEDIFFGALQGGNPGGEPLGSEDELAQKLENGSSATTVAPTPMMHGGGEWTALMTLISGSTYVLYCEPSFDADKICQLLQDEKALVILVVGDAMARPIADCLAANPGRYDLSHLFVLSSGGAILSRVVKDQLRALLPHVMILDGFGSSETGHGGSALVDSPDTDSPCFTLGPNTAVLDVESLEAIEPGCGVAGLFARKGHIPQGYYKDEQKTAETFRTDAKGARWVVPGDWALVEPDGTARLLGRGSGCINSGGEKIFPEEVESALKAHPEVFDAAVVGVPCPRFTEKVVALVQPRGDSRPTVEALSAFCVDKLAAYKLAREVVLVDEVPRTPAGKPDYRQVRQIVTRALAGE